MEKLNKYSSVLDLISKLLSALLKIGLLFGGGLIFFFCLKVGHFPQGLSLSDGVFFLWVAFCFSIVYLMAFCFLVHGGLLVSPIFIKMVDLCHYLRSYVQKNYKRSKSASLAAPKVNLMTVILGIIGLLVVAISYLLGEREFISFLGVMLMMSLLSLMWGKISGEFDELKKIVLGVVVINESEDKEQSESRYNHLKKGKIIIVIIMLVFPLMFFDFSGVLLGVAMKISGIKKENVSVFVKEPYSLLLSEFAEVNYNNKLAGLGYSKFVNINVFFEGMGDIVVIRSKQNKLVVPEKFILIGTKDNDQNTLSVPCIAGASDLGCKNHVLSIGNSLI